MNDTTPLLISNKTSEQAAPFFYRYDFVLLGATLLLVCFGFAMSYSAPLSFLASKKLPMYLFFYRNFIWFILGSIGLIFTAIIDYRIFQKWLYPIGFVVIILLIVVLFSKPLNGATRWLSVGGFSFQPTEFAKITAIFFLADWLSRKKDNLASFTKGLLPILLLVGVFTGLVVLQKDLGDAILMGGVAGMMIFIAGARYLHLLVLFFTALPVVYLSVVGTKWRLERLLVSLNPYRDPIKYGYQGIQARQSIFLGGFWGRGLGASYGKMVLPEAYTDYVFAVFAEELGFIGVCVLILAFLILFYRAFLIAYRAIDSFGFYLALGLSCLLTLQVLLNLGVVLGVLPAKGLPLTFISYGGSSLITNMVSIGILLNISLRNKASTMSIFEQIRPALVFLSSIKNRYLPGGGQKVKVVK